MDQNKEDIKESFCPSCIAIPLAMAGAGAAGYGNKVSHGKMKKILLWGGIAVTIVSLLVALYFLYIKKCDGCR